MPSYATTVKHALRALTGGNVVKDIDAGLRALADDLDAIIATDAQGTWDGLPAAGKSGRYYFASDYGWLLRDNGTGWDLVNGATVGDLIETLRSSDPPGGYYMIADGRSVTRASYPVLSSVVGGASTTIVLPDLRGASTVGPSAMGTQGNRAGNDAVQVAAGTRAGEVGHLLVAAESGTNANGATDNDGSHVHQPASGSFVTQNGTGSVFFAAEQTTPGGPAIGLTSTPSTSPVTQSHSLAGRPADSSHNTVHPVVGVNKLIRVK